MTGRSNVAPHRAGGAAAPRRPAPEPTGQERGPVRVLAGREAAAYLRSPLFLIGTALAAVTTVVSFTGEDGTSSTMNMIAPAAFFGVLGLFVLARLTRNSDRTAEAAGAVAVPERHRTLGLVAATVVPVTTALAWYAVAVVQYVVQPPADHAVPFGPVGHTYVLAVMFALSVVPAAGGPLLGLLIVRWLPRRGATALSAVVLVLVTIVMQGNFEWSHRWHMVWPWTYWYGPLGWSGVGSESRSWVALPGSPVIWIAYLVALCVLGVLAAVYHDPDSDRRSLRRAIAVVGVAALVALVLSMVLGLDQTAVNPVAGLSF